MHFPILSILIMLPLFGVFILSFLKIHDDVSKNNAKNVALLISAVCLILTLYLLSAFEHRYAGVQFEEIYRWIPTAESNIHFGVDGISVYFIVLTNILIPMCILASWYSIKERIKSYLIAFLFLQSMVIGFFVSLNILLFYIFFEAVLIPMFFIILLWGGEQKVQASFKMVLYTIFGSLFFLLAFIKIYIDTGETDLIVLQNYNWQEGTEKILWLACFIAFAIKLPMVPFHTWLPLAHTQAPTAGSVILAGVLLKMGGYGFLRFCLPIFPNASLYFSPYVIALSLMAIVYTSLVALVQTDMKKLIAYSSIAHMGFVTLGLFSFSSQGLSGAVVQMISHGFISAALFLCIGVLYDRFHTREIEFYGGLYKIMPRFGVLFLLFTMGSAGLPGTSGFVGEICVLIGSYRVMPSVAFIASIGVVLSAAYGLWLYKRLCLGALSQKISVSSQLDLTKIELFNLSALCALMLYFGIHAQPLFGLINPPVQKIENFFLSGSVKKKMTKLDVNADTKNKKGK